MKKLLFVCAVSTALTSFSPISPCYAGKGKPEINVRNFTYTKLFNQKTVWEEHTEILKKEGVEHLLTSSILSGKEVPLSLADNLNNNISQMQSDLGDFEEHLNGSAHKTSKDLDEALKADFLNKKTRAMQKTLTLNVLPSCWDAGCVGFSLATGLGGQFGVATAFGRLVGTAKEALRDVIIGGNDIISDNDPLEPLELKYVVMKRFLSFHVQESIEGLFTAARHSETAMERALEELPGTLNIPIHCQLPNSDFAAPIEALAKGYTTENNIDLAKSLKNFAMNHLSRFKPTKGLNHTPKHILILEGPAGVGKSHIAKKMARIMGVNLVEASLGGGLADFFGSKKTPGALQRALSDQDGVAQLNCLTSLEEVDRLLNEDKKAVGPLLRFLDPEAGEIDLGFGKFDWSQVAIIALVNHHINCEEINDRCEVIKITGVVKENKDAILQNKILPKFLTSTIPGMTLTQDDLPKEKVDEILKQTGNNGFRTQEAAMRDLCAEVRCARMNKRNLIEEDI